MHRSSLTPVPLPGNLHQTLLANTPQLLDFHRCPIATNLALRTTIDTTQYHRLNSHTVTLCVKLLILHPPFASSQQLEASRLGLPPSHLTHAAAQTPSTAAR